YSNRQPNHVSRKLHEKIVAGGTTVREQIGQLNLCTRTQGIEDIADLVGDRLLRGTDDVFAACVCGHSDDGRFCVGRPVWRAQTGEGRDQMYAAAGLDAGRDSSSIAGVLQK